MKNSIPAINYLILSWQRLITQTILIVYGYVFMEWLFFATKASFMDALPILNKLEILLLTSLALTIPVLLLMVTLRILGWIPGPTRRGQVFLYIGVVVPALICTAVSLMMIDNFTYTIFKFGIITSLGFLRGVYAVLAIGLLVAWYRQLIKHISILPPVEPDKRKTNTWLKWQSWLVIALLAVSLAAGLGRIFTLNQPTNEKNALLGRRPNIIMLGGDGVVAKNMGLYGYERDTTPRLQHLAKSSLLSENNFANADQTTGSVFSMLTGKYPATTRLLYAPSILQGQDSNQHLPGILHQAGYTTIQFTFPYYIDAYAVNMQDGFDQVNGRSLDQNKIYQLARQYNFENAGYFIPRLLERISDRLLHIFFIRVMPDPYRQVIQKVDPNTVSRLSDQEKINHILDTLRKSNKPVFMQVHLMDTHGEKFYPQNRVFSAGENQNQGWMTDFYDDAILDFDGYAGQLVDGLSRNHLLDNTIIVIYSDHADNWRANDKIPLLIRFPKAEYAGILHNDTQNMDIAPTLLDYLGMEKPTWMPGQTLLHGELSSTRPIISAGVVRVDCQSPDWWCVPDPNLNKPPFYQFNTIQVVICQKMYTLELHSKNWTETDVNGHTAPCKTADLPDSTHVRQIAVEHLRANGFDVSSLK